MKHLLLLIPLAALGCTTPQDPGPSETDIARAGPCSDGKYEYEYDEEGRLLRATTRDGSEDIGYAWERDGHFRVTHRRAGEAQAWVGEYNAEHLFVGSSIGDNNSAARSLDEDGLTVFWSVSNRSSLQSGEWTQVLEFGVDGEPNRFTDLFFFEDDGVNFYPEAWFLEPDNRMIRAGAVEGEWFYEYGPYGVESRSVEFDDGSELPNFSVSRDDEGYVTSLGPKDYDYSCWPRGAVCQGWRWVPIESVRAIRRYPRWSDLPELPLVRVPCGELPTSWLWRRY